jgi:hypothetical protein
MAIELKNRIEADLGASVPMVKFLEGPSVRDLAGYLAEQLRPILGSRTSEIRNPKPEAQSNLADVNGHGAERPDWSLSSPGHGISERKSGPTDPRSPAMSGNSEAGFSDPKSAIRDRQSKIGGLEAGELLARLDTLSDAEVDSLLSELCDAEKGA